jgi:hypothetical protein
MAVMVGQDARNLFRFLTGAEFPDIDEDLLRAFADAWEAAGTRLQEELGRSCGVRRRRSGRRSRVRPSGRSPG